MIETIVRQARNSAHYRSAGYRIEPTVFRQCPCGDVEVSVFKEPGEGWVATIDLKDTDGRRAGMAVNRHGTIVREVADFRHIYLEAFIKAAPKVLATIDF